MMSSLLICDPDVFVACVTLGRAGSWISCDKDHTWCFRMSYDVVTAHMWSRCFCRVCDSRQSRFLNILWHRPHIMSSRGACTVRICRNNPPRCPEDKQKNLCLFLIAVFWGRDADPTLKKKCPMYICTKKLPRRVVQLIFFYFSLVHAVLRIRAFCKTNANLNPWRTGCQGGSGSYSEISMSGWIRILLWKSMSGRIRILL